MSNGKRIVVIGAGPGGLTAAMLLAHRGFEVDVYEQTDQVGGRNAEIREGGYRFDIGPTFLMMKFLLDEVFEQTGRKADDLMDFRLLDPMYELRFHDHVVHPSSDTGRMKEAIARVFPGQEGGFDKFLARERVRFQKMYPCLQKDYSSVTSMLAPVFLKALPHLSLGNSIYDVLSNYFDAEDLRLSFTFQSKYLGMSPWSCPGAFTIIPYIEYGFGIYHVIGGLSEISRVMARVVAEEGGRIHLSTKVAQVIVEGGEAKGVILEGGERVPADAVVLNADFGHAMATLFPEGTIRKWNPQDLRKREYSCSTYMLYLGCEGTWDSKVHTICFASDYHRNLTEIAKTKVISEDPSFYVRNASVIDPTLAPEGHSALYVLVPTPNNQSGIDWAVEGPKMRERILDGMETRSPFRGVRDRIRTEVVITPADWEQRRDIFLGGTFNLAHLVSQMLYFRPHNRFEEVGRCFLTGGGTHPGSGLPTIYESGRISADLISRDFGVEFPPPLPLRDGP